MPILLYSSKRNKIDVVLIMSTSFRKKDTAIILGKEMLSENQRNEARVQMIILLEETKKYKKPVMKDIMHGGPMPYLGCHQLQVCYYT